jgi:hypothetical protein
MSKTKNETTIESGLNGAAGGAGLAFERGGSSPVQTGAAGPVLAAQGGAFLSGGAGRARPAGSALRRTRGHTFWTPIKR